MTRSQIIKAVQIRMSDVMPGNQIEVASHPFVDGLLNDSVENFYMMLPTNVLPHTDFKDDNGVTIDSDEVGVNRIQLPVNYIRLISFRTNEYKRSVVTTITEGSPEHFAQFGKYTYGGNARPRVTLVTDPTYGRCIEFYTDKDSQNTSVVDASCAVKSLAEEIPENLIDVFAWYVASTAFTALQEYDASKACMEKVMEFIQLHK